MIALGFGPMRVILFPLLFMSANTTVAKTLQGRLLVRHLSKWVVALAGPFRPLCRISAVGSFI
jgi:hypothetical protein